MAPSARIRSTRRFTADAERPTVAPISAKLRRASSTNIPTIRSSTGSSGTAVSPSMYRVDSEVGPLRQVILHRPGLELKRLTPGNKDRLLFDDVLWVHRAQQEHDRFADVLRERGVTVHLFADLLRQTLELPEAKAYVLDRIFDERVYGPMAIDALRNA